MTPKDPNDELAANVEAAIKQSIEQNDEDEDRAHRESSAETDIADYSSAGEDSEDQDEENKENQTRFMRGWRDSVNEYIVRAPRAERRTPRAIRNSASNDSIPHVAESTILQSIEQYDDDVTDRESSAETDIADYSSVGEDFEDQDEENKENQARFMRGWRDSVNEYIVRAPRAERRTTRAAATPATNTSTPHVTETTIVQSIEQHDDEPTDRESSAETDIASDFSFGEESEDEENKENQGGYMGNSRASDGVHGSEYIIRAARGSTRATTNTATNAPIPHVSIFREDFEEDGNEEIDQAQAEREGTASTDATMYSFSDISDYNSQIDIDSENGGDQEDQDPQAGDVPSDSAGGDQAPNPQTPEGQAPPPHTPEAWELRQFERESSAESDSWIHSETQEDVFGDEDKKEPRKFSEMERRMGRETWFSQRDKKEGKGVMAEETKIEDEVVGGEEEQDGEDGEDRDEEQDGEEESGDDIEGISDDGFYPELRVKG